LIYIDTSSLLKLFILDEHLKAVTMAIYRETSVVVSPLTELEASVQLRGMYLGGNMGAARFERTRGRLAATLANSPFVMRPLVSRIFSAAIAQHSTSTIHCRSLDRLHLAAMTELGVSRLMTHDGRQADGAKELGFDVLMPGVD
jgi:predicted nucleic acid-binding protein